MTTQQAEAQIAELLIFVCDAELAYTAGGGGKALAKRVAGAKAALDRGIHEWVTAKLAERGSR